MLRLADAVGEKGFVYGIDVSEGMLKKAEALVRKLEVSNVDFIKSDLEKIPLRDGTADLVISNCTINHAKNKQAVWNEIFRVLKEGGRFVISDIY